MNSNQTPLNPDDEARLEKALEQSANGQVVSRGSFAQYAQTPLVTSLEELDAMPDGSVVKDSVGEVYVMTPYDEFWRVWGNDKRFSSCEIVLPARVLDLPEASDA